jgi:hypothetical protein
MLSAVTNLTSSLLDVPFRWVLALFQLSSPLATPCESGELDFSQHRNLIWTFTLHCYTMISISSRKLLYSRLLVP